MKERRAREIGMNFRLFRYTPEISQSELETEVSKISADASIHGLIIQAPLPDHIDRYRVNECIDECKDVDGFTKAQIGNMFLGHDGLWSCTPKGILSLLSHYDISVHGKNVLVIGRSNIVGKPMSLMLINAGATVVTANSQTKNLSELTKKADIIIVAAGRPNLITRDMIHEQSIIIDVGCTFVEGIACGDVNREAIEPYVRALSPVPG
jgi:methylenetetrahydrofolate dehydrogenase (NADP+)/methenyltetrahydrofolate cyclohydrolase